MSAQVQREISEQSLNMHPVQIVFGEAMYCFSIFSHWSINKIKCLITAQIPKLDFDEFQLSYQKKLLRGNYLLSEVIAQVSQKDNRPMQLQIIRTESQIKLKEYYRQRMGKIIEGTKNYDMPILNVAYQKSINLIKNDKHLQNNINVGQGLNELQDDNQIPLIFVILRGFGVYLFFSVLRLHGTFFQVGLIISVVLLYAVIQWQRRHNRQLANRNRNNNNNIQNQRRNPTQKNNIRHPQNVIKKNIMKAELLLRLFKFIQIVYVFSLSFFPNWEVQVHLHQNANRIKAAQAFVNKFRPQTFIIEGQQNTTTKTEITIQQNQQTSKNQQEVQQKKMLLQE